MSQRVGSHDKPAICFVSLNNFATLVDNPAYGHIGGAEMQQAIIGRELIKRGYKVSFITLDHGQSDGVEVDGIRIVKAYDPKAGTPVLRFLHPRISSLWRAMKRADADVYYQRTSDSVTSIVAAFCRRHRRRFVFAVAADADCIRSLPYCTARHERVLFRWGLRRADVVVAQTLRQKELLRKNFGLDSTVIPNCTLDHERCLSAPDAVPSSPGNHVLWIGSFSPVKRLELLLDVAERCQGLHFDVVGDGPGESEYVHRLRSRARTLPNVHLHGRTPHARVQQLYQQTAVLLCTSSAEGLPNTFLEAWSHGVPVVTTFDPDGMIGRQGLGRVGADVPELVAGIQELLDSPERWRETSTRGRQWYLQNFAVDVVMAELERVFADPGTLSISGESAPKICAPRSDRGAAVL
jgi:glycosyltransferase involved in cell wall biosynthesis